MSKPKKHILSQFVEFARTNAVELVEAALALMLAELKARQPAKPAPAKRGRPAKVRPSSTPPVNPASRIPPQE